MTEINLEKEVKKIDLPRVETREDNGLNNRTSNTSIQENYPSPWVSYGNSLGSHVPFHDLSIYGAKLNEGYKK